MISKSIATEEEWSISPSHLRDSLARDGYIIIPSFYSQLELTRLREACYTVTELARNGKWPFIRTLPKQFPPWPPTTSTGIWGIQHLLHPSLPPTTHATFITSYFHPTLLSLIKKILSSPSNPQEEVKDEDLVMELYNLLVRPDSDFELRWHRDGIANDATEEEEVEVLGRRVWHTQWNAALYDDNSLLIIPCSHLRPRTSAERNASPYATDLEGIKTVEMKAGDVVFYNNNILHRGVYDRGKERMTLHGSVGCVKGEGSGSGRARNVLQHGVGEWVERLDLSCLEGEQRVVAEGMRGRLLRLGEENREVGYLHDG